MTSLLLPWGFAATLVGLALVGGLLPSSRAWHRAGVIALSLLAVLGVAAAAVLTWTTVQITEDEIYDATTAVADEQQGAPGQLSQQRLAALVSDRLGVEAFAEYVGATAEETTYEVRPDGQDDPAVCVRVTYSAGTESDLPASSLDVERGACG